jgi:hypothetical protein
VPFISKAISAAIVESSAHEAMTAKLPDVAALCGGGFDFAASDSASKSSSMTSLFRRISIPLRKSGQVDIHRQVPARSGHL